EKNASKAIQAIERAKTAPLSRWLYALAIPEVGETTATDLARFHETIDDVANSQLLRDVVSYHGRKSDKSRDGGAKEIADRLIKSGFAEPAKSKIGQCSKPKKLVIPSVSRGLPLRKL